MNTPFVIIGIGKSGLSAKNLLLASGVLPEKIYTYDEKSNAANFNSWEQLNNLEIGTLVLSPGVPLNSSGLIQLVEKGWTLTSEINLACQYLTDEIIVGITGSVGKSTVTSLLGVAALAEDPNAFVGGNLGVPFCDYALQVLTKKAKAKFVILELSSYQLENCKSLKLDYSAITFLSANHLERYPSADAYYKTKCQISNMTKNICVLNKSSADLVDYQKNIVSDLIFVNYETSMNKIDLNKAKLIGEHNLDNLELAFTIGKKMGLAQSSLNLMFHYEGLPHRLEIIGLHKGCLYINDSKATAMDSVLVAVAAGFSKIKPTHKLYLLLGGRDKNLPWEELKVLNKNTNLIPLFFGECGQLVKQKSSLPGQYYSRLEQAIIAATESAAAGDVVLLSPGGTSLDEFKNFEARGDFFKKIVSIYSEK